MRNRSKYGQRIFHALLSLTAVAASIQSHAANQPNVYLSPTENIQQAVTAAAAGTTFILSAGIYRMQSIQPKTGDIFEGEGNVVLNGSQVLTFAPDPAKSGFWVANVTASNVTSGTCDSTHPMCIYTQDLFLDSSLVSRASQLQGLQAGSWYFDQVNGKVYLPADPTGHEIELSTTNYAFYGKATKVQIKNLIVEKYATPANNGAIGGDGQVIGWIVNSVESRWNHGAGIFLSTSSQIVDCYAHHNGQIGIVFGGTGGKAVGNEISWNNYAGFDQEWEAGGGKFWATTNLTVESNYVHDNQGKGLWTDTNNVNTLFAGNTVVNNAGVGIQHEVSYSAVIRNNVVLGNSAAPTTWLGNAQIRINNSSNVQVSENTVEAAAVGGNGIAVVNENRGGGSLGPWVSNNNTVEHNTITYLGAAGVSGIEDDSSGTSSETGNHFDYNHYVLSDGGEYHWRWFGKQSWPLLQSIGQETHGVLSTK